MESECWTRKIYLLLEDVKGEVKSKKPKLFSNSSQSWEASKGIFLEEISDDVQPSDKEKVFLRSMDNPKNTVTVHLSQVFKLLEDYYFLIMAIPNRSHRVETVHEPNKLKLGKAAKPDDFVRVETKSGAFEAKIKYKGPISWGKGIFFGVEFEKKVGDCNGSPHFECEDKHGSFVTLNDIHFVNKYEKTPASNNKTLIKDNRKQFNPTSSYKGKRIGMKVHCIILDYPEPLKGFIAYIGTKESKIDPVVVGVQLYEKPRKPIKNGNFYNGCKLFECPEGLGYITTDIDSLQVEVENEGYVLVSNKKENLSMSGYNNYPPSNYSPSNYPPSNYPPSNYPPSGYPPSGYPPSNYPPSGYPPSDYPPSGYPPIGYPPSDYLSHDEENTSKFLSKDEISLKKIDKQQNLEVLSKKMQKKMQENEKVMQESETNLHTTGYLPQHNLQNLKIKSSTNTGRSLEPVGMEKSSNKNNFSNKSNSLQSENLKLHERKARFTNDDINDDMLYPGDEELYTCVEEFYPTGVEEMKPSSQEIQGLDKKFKTAARDVFVILAEKLSTEWMYYGKLLCINDQCLYILNNQPNSLKDKMLSVLNEWKGNNPDKGWSHLRKLLLLRNEGELVKTCEMKLNDVKLMSSLQLNDMVEFQVSDNTYYGVLKWRGFFPKVADELAGIELEESSSYLGTTDGTFMGVRCFVCLSSRGYFLKLSRCKPDTRFQSLDIPISKGPNINSGKLMTGYHLPVSKLDHRYVGKERGIQGHINSCYMDATLFAMFAFSYVFDFILYRKSGKEDASYIKVQKCLHQKIVNPLRVNGYVEQQSIMELREFLNELGNIGGFLDKEKDPEEFIALLFEKVLKVDPFINLSLQNQPDIGLYLYQIIADVNPLNPQPSIQFLLEMSFLSGKTQLLQTPSVMIVQVPRSGTDKIFNRIQINSTLDISPFLQDAEHFCVVCGERSFHYCPNCVCEFGLDKVYTFLCEKCWHAVHSHQKRLNHAPVTLKSPSTVSLELLKMELFAVVCIKTSHYISFVKCGEGNESSWVFFDSMADRHGNADGYNIPEVVEVPELNELLNATPLRISKINKDDCALRLYEDASLCFYRNSQMSMYT